MRENPASDRRHGSRFAQHSDGLSNSTKEEHQLERKPTAQNQTASILSQNAVRSATTEREGTVRATDEVAFEPQERKASVKEAFEPLISSEQAARLLGNIHVKTLQRYARHGALPGYQIGGHWYFRESELDAWLRDQINSNRQSVR